MNTMTALIVVPNPYNLLVRLVDLVGVPGLMNYSGWIQFLIVAGGLVWALRRTAEVWSGTRAGAIGFEIRWWNRFEQADPPIATPPARTPPAKRRIGYRNER